MTFTVEREFVYHPPPPFWVCVAFEILVPPPGIEPRFTTGPPWGSLHNPLVKFGLGRAKYGWR